MTWVPLDDSLADHWKLQRLSDALATDSMTLIGHLSTLWNWCMTYAPDGDLSRFTDTEIARAARWPHDPKAFVVALDSAGFVDVGDNDTLRIHDWDDYGGKLLKEKQANAKHQRDYKQRKKTVSLSSDLPKVREERTQHTHTQAADLCPDSSDEGIHLEQSRTYLNSKQPMMDRFY